MRDLGKWSKGWLKDGASWRKVRDGGRQSTVWLKLLFTSLEIWRAVSDGGNESTGWLKLLPKTKWVRVEGRLRW